MKKGSDERGLLVVFAWVCAVHVLLRALGHAEAVALLSGTIPAGYSSLGAASFWAVSYLLSWFGLVVCGPMLLLAAAFLRFGQRVRQ